MGNRAVRQLRVLVLGLKGAGKTNIIFNLRLGEVITTIPCIGFSVETVEYENVVFTIFDVGGADADKWQKLWSYYFANTDALIFVVDSNDIERLRVARDELKQVLSNKEMSEVVLLVLSNKQDLPWSLSPEEVAERLGLFQADGMKNCWSVHGSCARDCNGLFEGIRWLTDILWKRVPYEGPKIGAGSLGIIEEPERINTTRHVVVLEEPGSCVRTGVLAADSAVSVVEVLRPSAAFALYYGRIEEPVKGWIALHGGQVRANYLVLSLHCSLRERENICISCCSMAGEELVLIELQHNEIHKQTVADLQKMIAKRIKKDRACLRLVTSSSMALESEEQLLVDVLRCDGHILVTEAAGSPPIKKCLIS